MKDETICVIILTLLLIGTIQVQAAFWNTNEEHKKSITTNKPCSTNHENRRFAAAEPTNTYGLGETNTDWWPMFRHDLRRTAHSTSKAPNNDQILWSYATGSVIGFSSPAVADGKVYIGSWDRNVYALNATNGFRIWNYTTGDSVYSSPAVADDKVFISSYDNKVYALNATTGTPIWNYTTADDVDSSPAVAEGKVYIGSRDNKVHALNASTGTFIWSYTTGSGVLSSPAVADGKVFIGSYDNKVYALNASIGALIWSYKTGSWVYSSPAVADNKVFIGSFDRRVYAFGSHDVAICNVTTSTTQAYVGQIVDINVTARNEGTETETFNVTAYSNTTAIETRAVTNLASNVETTLTFNWNTTNVTLGNYTIKAVASAVPGETDTADNTYIDGSVKLVKSPVAHFTYSPTTPLTEETVTFNASLSTPDGGTIISYEWNFGDGTPNATGMIATHAYIDNGTYTVTLTVIDDDGLSDTDSQNITVLNRLPIASFVESATAVPTYTVITFNASSSYDPDGYIVSYFWDFGDNISATGVTTEHAYADNGTYIVTLTITDDDGATATATATKTVSNRVPTTSFSENATIVYTSEIIHFNASESFDPDGEIVSYFWDFGDGTNATGVIVEHSYADNGTYKVTLTVTDDDGATASTSAFKTVLNRAPGVSFTESATAVLTYEIIYFDASGSGDPDGVIVAYFWEFGDGTNATGVSVSHAYVDDGIYTVTLTVTDDDDATASAQATKTILNRSPIANFTESAETVYNGETITFNASDSYDLDGIIICYFWDFGDGTNATEVVVSHVYPDDGFYVVTLTVTDDDGAVATATAVKTVLNRPPVASFTESAEKVFVDETITFDASGSYDPDGVIVAYFWDFGDGTNATDVTVNHTYPYKGTYTVTLSVKDDDGVSTSTSAVKTVLTRPDIEVINVTSSKNIVGQRYSILINVTIANEGDYTETFDVTAYANMKPIKTKAITLTSKSIITINFEWNTTGFDKGNYTIWSYAWPILGEIDTADNTKTDGWVIIAIVGDINADGIVDIEDLYLIALAYGTTPGHPRYNPNLDVNCDGIIDIEDIYVAALHYGEKDP